MIKPTILFYRNHKTKSWYTYLDKRQPIYEYTTNNSYEWPSICQPHPLANQTDTTHQSAETGPRNPNTPSFSQITHLTPTRR